MMEMMVATTAIRCPKQINAKTYMWSCQSLPAKGVRDGSRPQVCLVAKPVVDVSDNILSI